MQQRTTRNDGEGPRQESSEVPAAGGVPQTFTLESIRQSTKWWGAEVCAAVLYRAFIAEQEGRRGLVRVWLEVYRQLVEEDRPREEGEGGSRHGGRISGA
jgi:hypothetical protein